MNSTALILSKISVMSERYGERNIDIAKAIVSMIDETFNNRSIGRQQLLSVCMYTFGCLEIYRTLSLNGGFMSASFSGVDNIPISESVPRVVFIEAYSAVFIEKDGDKKIFEFESNMMFGALFKIALSHYLSDRSLEFLFNNLRLDGVISKDESTSIERYAKLLNGMISHS